MDECRDLVGVIGVDLSFLAVVLAMIGSKEAWRAVRSSCEAVILQKEQAEYARKAAGSGMESNSPDLTGGGGGGERTGPVTLLWFGRRGRRGLASGVGVGPVTSPLRGD